MTTAPVEDFCPDWVSSPGDTIADILRSKSLSDEEFAQRAEFTPQFVRDLLGGRATITIAVARRLQNVLGASVEFWMSRDFQYRQDVARLCAAHQEWLSELPLADMINFGWLTPVPHPAEEVAACLRFFNVPSVRAWRDRYASVLQLTAFRTSPSFDSRPGAVAAWLREGEIFAETIECNRWNPESFESSLLQIRSLTREYDPECFIPKLQRHCAESGVAVAIVPAPSGCRASGATRFLSQDKAILLLSFRYLTDDHFWFSFFHEAGHLLLHADRGIILDGLDNSLTREETEANEFAANLLVPPESRAEFLELRTTAREVIRFAKRIGVSPGIVVGQMQHFKRIRHNQLNTLKRRFKWEIQ